MEERTIETGGIYRHFKNKLYQVICIAYHSETGEKMVVYQALYGNFSVYVRPYDMFISEVDQLKYPEVTQKYRFEPVHLDASGTPYELEGRPGWNGSWQPQERQQGPAMEAVQQEQGENAVDSRLMRFLDAESFQEKLDTLTALKAELDDKLIDAMAASMEVEVPEGPVEVRYASLRKCILAHTRYECTRLR